MGNRTPKPVSGVAPALERLMAGDDGQRVRAVGKPTARGLRARAPGDRRRTWSAWGWRAAPATASWNGVRGASASAKCRQMPARPPQLRDRGTKWLFLLQPLTGWPPWARPGLEMHQRQRAAADGEQQRADWRVKLAPVRGRGRRGLCQRGCGWPHGRQPVSRAKARANAGRLRMLCT
jgi:hypothetical protein